MSASNLHEVGELPSNAWLEELPMHLPVDEFGQALKYDDADILNPCQWQPLMSESPKSIYKRKNVRRTRTGASPSYQITCQCTVW